MKHKNLCGSNIIQYGIIETMHEIILKRRKLLTVSNDDVDRLNKKRTKN